MPQNPKMRMASEAVDVLARLRAIQSFPWRCLSSMEGGRGLAAVATIVGAVGTLVFVKGMSGGWNKDDDREEREVTVPGLQNAGSNCFLNVILQALGSSEKFSTFLKDETLGVEVLEPEGRPRVMPLSAALSELLEKLSQVAPGARVINPSHVMRFLGYYARDFDLAKQQDASEALFYIAKALQQERMEEFEDYRRLAQSLAYPPQLTGHNMSMELEYWTEQLRWPMEGTYASSLRCTQCGFEGATQVQFFREILLALPCTRDWYIADGCTIEDCLDLFTSPERVSNFRCNRCSHLAALRIKPQTEILKLCNYDDDCSCEALFRQQVGFWPCVRGDAYKCLQIGRCPEVLCLQLQRVMINSAGEAEKVSGHVSFPTELDIYPYTVAAQQDPSGKQALTELRPLPAAFLKPRKASDAGRVRCSNVGVEAQSDSGISAIISRYQKTEASESQEMAHFLNTEAHLTNMKAHLTSPEDDVCGNNELRKRLYDLISVVVHHGSPMAGHYTVYRKARVNRRQTEELHGTSNEEAIWFEISDATVVKVSEKKVLRADASLLFYEMR